VRGGKLLIGGLTPVIILAALVAIGAWFGRTSAAKKMKMEREKEQQSIATVPVTEGPFEVTVTAVGKLEAVDSKRVSCEIQGQLIRIVPNGVKVKKDDIIAVLDVPRMVRQARDLESQFQTSQADLERKKRDLAAEVERARITLSQANKEMDRFKATQQAEVADKKGQKDYDEQDLGISRTRFDRKSRLADEALLPKRDVELATAEIKAKDYNLERQSKDLDLTEAKKAAELLDKQAAVDKAKADLARAEAAQQDETRNATMNLEINKQQLGRAKDQLSKAIIKSPADGIVVLGQQWQMGGQRPLEAGDRAWEGMLIATVPDLSKMRVALDLSQVDARVVKRKQKVVIRVDALPAMTFDGEVSEMAQTAKEASLRGTGIPTGERAFSTKVGVKDTKKMPLRPGMTATARIIVERIPKAVSIPLECAFDQDERKIVYLQHEGRFRPVEVELGPQNEDMVVIKKGMKAGDRVALRDIGERGGRAPSTQAPGSQLPL